MNQNNQIPQTKAVAVEVLKNLSIRDFLSFGMREVAYIKPVVIESREAYAIHAADGTPLSVMDSLESAVMMVRHNDMQVVTLQ